MTTETTRSKLLTMKDAAELLSVSTRFVRAAVHDGSIGTVRLGRLVRFRPDEIEAYLERQSVQPHQRRDAQTEES
jgi:excisionase family DNA binding protein